MLFCYSPKIRDYQLRGTYEYLLISKGLSENQSISSDQCCHLQKPYPEKYYSTRVVLIYFINNLCSFIIIGFSSRHIFPERSSLQISHYCYWKRAGFFIYTCAGSMLCFFSWFPGAKLIMKPMTTDTIYRVTITDFLYIIKLKSQIYIVIIYLNIISDFKEDTLTERKFYTPVIFLNFF